MMQMSWVVTNLVYMRGHLSDESVVLLEIDRQERVALASNLCETSDVFPAVNSDPDQVGACGVDDLHLPEGGCYISGLSGCHALNSDRRVTSDGEVTDVYLACLALRDHETGMVPLEAGLWDR